MTAISRRRRSRISPPSRRASGTCGSVASPDPPEQAESMEGNECYKFPTIRNYLDLTHADPVRVMIDIGANVAAVTRMMKAYFPDARVYACEAVDEYATLAEANTRDLPGVTVWRRAV